VAGSFSGSRGAPGSAGVTLLRLAFAILLLGLAAGTFAFPSLLRAKIESAGSAVCPDCRLELGGLAWSISPFGVRLSGVRFRSGDTRDSAVFVEARRVLVPLRPSSLGGGPLRLGRSRAEGLAVTVWEGDAHFPSSARSGEGAGFEAEGFEATGASFTYRKDSPAGTAYLRIGEVEASGGRFGTSAAYVGQPLRAHAGAVLEKSGKIDLTVSARYFVAPAWADVDLRVDGQRLAGVNGYFEPEEGVTLRGRLLKSRALVKVRATRAEGWVFARFDGLGLKFHRNRHRGGFAALLDNLAVRVKLKGENLDDPPVEAQKAVVSRRHARESAVSFVLRTLREAAVRVAGK